MTQGVYITEDGSNHLSVNATIDQRITQRDNSFVNQLSKRRLDKILSIPEYVTNIIHQKRNKKKENEHEM